MARIGTHDLQSQFIIFQGEAGAMSWRGWFESHLHTQLGSGAASSESQITAAVEDEEEKDISNLVAADLARLKIETENQNNGFIWPKQENLASTFQWKPLRLCHQNVSDSAGVEDRVVLFDDIQAFLIDLPDSQLLHALILYFIQSLKIVLPVSNGEERRQVELLSCSTATFGRGIVPQGAAFPLSSNSNFFQDRLQVSLTV